MVLGHDLAAEVCSVWNIDLASEVEQAFVFRPFRCPHRLRVALTQLFYCLHHQLLLFSLLEGLADIPKQIHFCSD
jgi:hypothetical protein